MLTAAALLAALPISQAPAVAQETNLPPAPSGVTHPYAPHVANAARRFGIPEAWIWAVMRVESAGNTRAVSRAGAMGLMQIMPGTWAQLRARYGLGTDPFDLRDNIMAGAAYLREMHDRYGSASAMLAAYNAGPGRYDDHLSRGRPLPAETVAYLARLGSVTGTDSVVEVAVVAPPDHFAWRRSALFVLTSAATAEADLARPEDEIAAADKPTAEPSVGNSTTTGPSRATPTDGLFAPRAGAGRPQ
ncbi:MAG: lytic transglycosylase domain-containing protein [Alphaproteobacteria bacterium]|nr:lytic transglycosylase domain-containing protein [Alphaproteobacteria bacterium]MBU0792617.1 lytic transglycosylase domain-containing protein [Alphaproteobacteria bacterium]MBU0876761.1 lytic transglycosylase domain-containing protein [Alphaproteobacteria bacterium]MBU1769007.1 lytic transglycosylase domain-containing protein [Alphaproteobacteria bacterium]